MKGIFSVLLLATLFPVGSMAQEVCPFGLENDPAPGACARYIDRNADSICDLSEVPLVVQEAGSAAKASAVSEGELKQRTVAQVAGLYGIDAARYSSVLSDFLKAPVRETDRLQDLHDRNGLCAGVAGALALNLKSNPNGIAVAIDPAEKTAVDVPITKDAGRPRYQLAWIALGLLALHSLTHFLAKAKKIRLIAHRRLWNSLLLASFVSSALLGLLLIIRINWGWTVALPFNILYWHVETATAMAVITLFHLSWYWRFYAVIFRKNNNA